MGLFRRRRGPKPPPVPTRPWPPSRSDASTYTVDSGWAILAELKEGTLHWQALRNGTSHTTDPARPHSLYVPRGARVSTAPDPDPPVLDENSASPAVLDELLAALAEQDTVHDRVIRR
jgi:hypothetical protein